VRRSDFVGAFGSNLVSLVVETFSHFNYTLLGNVSFVISMLSVKIMLHRIIAITVFTQEKIILVKFDGSF
jgi:fatty-acid desaturase